MALPSVEKPVALVLPGYAFYVSYELAAGIAEVLDSNGISWISISGGYLSSSRERDDLRGELRQDIQRSNWIYDFLPKAEFSGAVLYGGGLGFDSQPERMQQLVDSLGSIPMVNVGSVGLKVPCVNADNYQGMLDLVREISGLLKDRKGPASSVEEIRLLFISGPEGNSESDDRLRAFMEGTSESGIPVDEGRILQGDFSSDTARRLVEEYLDANDRPPDGIICANDLSAFGASEVLHMRDIRIPKDVLITGFDDFEYAAAMQPSLTTVHFPIREMGREAARLLIDQMNASGAEERITVPDVNIPAFTVFRESTGHRLKPRQIIRAREILQFDMRAKERYPFRAMITKILLEGPRMKSIMPELMRVLPDCGITAMLVFLYNPRNSDADPSGEDDGDIGSLEQRAIRLDDGFLTDGSDSVRIDPDSFILTPGEPVCPPELFEGLQRSGSRMHLCPLQHEDEHLGYLLFSSDEVALDFLEQIAYQLSGYLYRWRLIRRSEKQRSELKSLVDELQNMQSRLTHVERLTQMNRLVAGVSHELNTPVGSSLTLASFMADRAREVLDGQDPASLEGELGRFVAQTAEAADSLMRNLDRTTELIRMFRSLAVDPAEQRIRRFSLYQVLDICVQRFISLPDFSLSVRSFCPEDLELVGDPEAVEACIEQLMDNSIRHSYGGKGEGRIDISVVRESARIELRYRDFGSLNKSLEIERIFEPFYTTDRFGGRIGLGLHIVHNLVQYRIRGGIAVSSHREGGIEFIISMPLDRSIDE
jgi:DNA-binding LacI/PurR family transcriptional regulator/signal transduction histidine kinase